VILIVSFPDNQHVEQVRRHLRVEHAVLDQADLPERVDLTARTHDGRMTLTLRLPDGALIDLDDVRSIWMRRLHPFRLAPELDPVGAQFAWSECQEALMGVWNSVRPYWMNHPLADEAAQRKVLQLRVAQEVGLSIPETLVTNDPAEAEAFVDRVGPGRVVRKAFRNLQPAPRQTALVGDADRALLRLVRHAPVIFQRFVPAVADLRVTVVDDEVFAALIRSDAGHQVDYRPGLGTADVSAHDLPEDVAGGLLALMARLGLTYGAIDLRLTPEGEYVFLEVNPAGEYLFASERTGQPVPQAIAAALTRGAVPRSAPTETVVPESVLAAAAP
jgi:glutathione synthase/RimK-type ligase-like ATP-grasp enzyme